MNTTTLLFTLVILGYIAFVFGNRRSRSMVDSSSGFSNLNSLPFYHGMLTALLCAIPSLLILLVWSLLQNTFMENMLGSVYGLNPEPFLVDGAARLIELQATNKMLLTAVTLILAIVMGCLAVWHIYPEKKARNHVESTFKNILLMCASLAVFITVAIVFSVLFESIRFFEKVPVFDFIFGLHWSPQMALRADQIGGSGSFGAIPLFVGTLLISLIAMIVAVPTGLMSAIYLSEYASSRTRSIVKPLLEILAGIPTVVYGFFAALTVAPFIRESGGWVFNILGLDLVISSESALAAGLVMGVMIIPFVSSLSDDVISAVPGALRDGSLGLGATQSETIRQVVLPAALPGIVSSVLLAASRAIGETMIVVMAAGLAAHLTMNPLESVTTVTVQIVTLLVGDQEFDSPKTLSAFALGLMLFVVTLSLNFIALHVVKKYREAYE
jgi:phosphate transport system permease protein